MRTNYDLGLENIIPVPCSFRASMNSPTNGTFYNRSLMLAGLVRAANWSIVPAAGNPSSAAKSWKVSNDKSNLALSNRMSGARAASILAY